MSDIELTSAETPVTDELTLAEREWADAQTDATIIIWALKHADRLLSLARAGLEARKAEEIMRERAALEAERISREYEEQAKGAPQPQYGGRMHRANAARQVATAIRSLPPGDKE